jgi:hypothetical protein
MRRSCAIPLILALCLAPPADAKHKRKHRCAIRDGVAVLHSKKAVILKRGSSDNVEDGIEYYGCLRSKKRPFLVASSSSNQYTSSSIDLMQLRGAYFAYADSYGDINSDCRASVNVVSIRTRVARYAPATLHDGKFGDCPGVGKLVATDTGAAAWSSMQGADSFIRKLDSGGPATLDQGPDVDPASLALTGSTLSWNRGSAELR